MREDKIRKQREKEAKGVKLALPVCLSMWDETLASTYVEPSDKTNNSRDGGELRILDVEVLNSNC